MRQVQVPVVLLAALVEAAKRVTPRGHEDEDHIVAMIRHGERLLGHRDDRAA